MDIIKNTTKTAVAEIKMAQEIVNEIRNFGVNDNIICMIVEQLALDLTDLDLMRDLRETASRGSVMANMTKLKEKKIEF